MSSCVRGEESEELRTENRERLRVPSARIHCDPCRSACALTHAPERNGEPRAECNRQPSIFRASRATKRVIPAPQTGHTPRAMERPPALVSNVTRCIGWRTRQRAHQPIRAPFPRSSSAVASSGAACSGDARFSALVLDLACSAESTGDTDESASPGADAGGSAGGAGGAGGSDGAGKTAVIDAVRLKASRCASISAARRRVTSR